MLKRRSRVPYRVRKIAGFWYLMAVEYDREGRAYHRQITRQRSAETCWLVGHWLEERQDAGPR